MSGVRKFTVVLERPDYMADEDLDGCDIYVGQVRAADSTDAINMARSEVFQADINDKLEPFNPGDYAVIVVFKGHCDACLFGWQAGVNERSIRRNRNEWANA